LPGANVIIDGTALGAATDLEGTYRIAGIPEGEHTVVVSFLGYQVRRVPISLTRGQTMTLHVALSPAVVEGVEIVVEGQVEGQAAAINQQITSNTIVNVISE